MSRLRAFIVTALTTCLSQPSFGLGLDLSLTARAEAGLDPATRQFINSLPQVWRPELTKIVEEALSRADKSVAIYINSIDKLLTTKIKEAQCAAVGGSATIMDTIVQNFPWVNKVGPMSELGNYIANEESRLSSNKNPTFVKDLLNDISFKASIVSCQNFAVQTAKVDAQKIIENNSKRWLAWNRVELFGCSEVQTCIGPYRDELANQIANANAEDVKTSQSADKLKKFNAPKPSSWWARPLPFAEYEKAVISLYEIENSLGAAKAIREGEAVKIISRSDSSLESARNQYNAIRDSVVPHFIKPFPIGPTIKIAFKPSQEPDLCKAHWGELNNMLEPARAEASSAKRMIAEAKLKAPIFIDEYNSRLQKIDTFIQTISTSSSFCT